MNEAQTLAAYIRSLPDFEVVTSIDGNYGHMGATITDAILQAGVKYKTVAEPRVKGLMQRHPEAKPPPHSRP